MYCSPLVAFVDRLPPTQWSRLANRIKLQMNRQTSSVSHRAVNNFNLECETSSATETLLDAFGKRARLSFQSHNRQKHRSDFSSCFSFQSCFILHRDAKSSHVLRCRFVGVFPLARRDWLSTYDTLKCHCRWQNDNLRCAKIKWHFVAEVLLKGFDDHSARVR